jgi:type VI secretion system protein VasD
MMRMMRRAPIALLMLASCGWLTACGSSPPKPQPVKINLVASADVNPDAENRPSPVVVRVYQLKDDAAFKDADFFALYDKEQATLAAALVSRVEFELAPGEQRAVDYQLTPDAHFVVVVAAYRDIRNAQWRAEIGAPDKPIAALVKKNKISVKVEHARVSIAPN